MVEVRIRPARSTEHEQISALAMRSKGHWGYDAGFLEACRDELTFDAGECGSGLMWVCVADGGELSGADDGRIVGFGLLRGAPPAGELTALFVDPTAIGTGCGRLLLRHLLREATGRGFRRLELDADPQAASFYLRFGARQVGSTPSGSIPGRLLPHLEFRLDPAPSA